MRGPAQSPRPGEGLAGEGWEGGGGVPPTGGVGGHGEAVTAVCHALIL